MYLEGRFTTPKPILLYCWIAIQMREQATRLPLRCSVRKCDIFGARCTVWSKYASYTNVPPPPPRHSPWTWCVYPSLFVPGRQMRIYTTYRRYRSTERGGHDTASEIAVVVVTWDEVLQGPLLRSGVPSFRPPVNIVYWLPPPISQTLVTRSCRSPTANKPRAVIWHRCLIPSRFQQVSRFDGLSLFLSTPRSLCPNKEKLSVIRVITS